MAKGVYVKDQGVVEFPDETDDQTMLQSLRRKFSNFGKSALGAGEAALSIGSSALAEPVSGLAGLVGAAIPGQQGQGASYVRSVGDVMTYEPITDKGIEYMQKVAEILQPVGDIVQGASQNLGDKAYSATGSPALAAAAYSAPTAFLEGLGLKGLGIARKPVSGADLYTPKMVSGPITSVHQLFDLTPGALATQLRTSDPSKLTESGAWRQQSGRFYTDYMPDGSAVMFMNDGRMLKQMSPDEAKRLFRERILEVETSKPEAQQIIEQRNQAIEQPKSENDYRMQHKAPTRSGGNPIAADLSSVFDDIYGQNALKYNSHGAPYDKKAIGIIQSLRGNPDKEIEIFRAVPKGVSDINAGDWVTTTKEYARDHIGDSKDYHIISKKVKASEIASDGNSIHEFGYEPMNVGAGAVGDGGITVFRGVGEGSDDSIIKWVSPDEGIAKGYAKARGGNVERAAVKINSPAKMGAASRRDKPASLISSIIRDASSNKGYDVDAAKQARKEFINYFGNEPLDITDLWSTEEAKGVTSKMLKSLGYDAISVTEQGVDTYGLIK